MKNQQLLDLLRKKRESLRDVFESADHVQSNLAKAEMKGIDFAILSIADESVAKKAFPLQHVVLYAKNWYKSFDPQGRGKNKTIFDDLRICLTLDGYSGEFFSKGDIASILATKCSEYLPNQGRLELTQILAGISPNESWKSGYYTNQSRWVKQYETFPEYDYETAIVYYFISILRAAEMKDLGELCAPVYSIEEARKLPHCRYIEQILPRQKGITSKKLEHFFAPKKTKILTAEDREVLKANDGYMY